MQYYFIFNRPTEIEQAVEQIGLECNSYKELGAGPVTVLPSYASLPPDQQRRVFSEVPGRKIVILY